MKETGGAMTPQSVEMGTILERLQKLENQNRRLRRALASLFVLVGSFAALGLASKKGRVVQATEFLLKDGEAKTRAALRMGRSGPYLVFYDANGKAARALVGILSSGPALGLYDAAGKTRVSLGVTTKGANLTFHDADEKLRAELGALEEGPNLMFLDPEGKPVYKTQ
jgi:hypothetical protein